VAGCGKLGGRAVAGEIWQQVITRYFDLFDPDCPPFPADSQLPVVFVDEKLVSSGGKISIPLIRKEIESLIQER
jgi:hypothetical protein